MYDSREMEAGWVVWVDGHLLHRPCKTSDNARDDVFCSELDSNTLKVRMHMNVMICLALLCICIRIRLISTELPR